LKYSREAVRPIEPFKLTDSPDSTVVVAAISRIRALCTYLGFRLDGGIAQPRIVRCIDRHTDDPAQIEGFEHSLWLATLLDHPSLDRLAPLERGAVFADEPERVAAICYAYVFGKDLLRVWNQCARFSMAFPVDCRRPHRGPRGPRTPARQRSWSAT